jgi:hypothetical protein
VRFQPTISAIFRQTTGVDVRSFEAAPSERVSTELRPIVLSLVGKATGVLAELLRECEGCSEAHSDERTDLRESYLPFEHAVDASVRRSRGSLRALEEIAFIAQLELRQRDARLRRVNGSSHLLIGEADSALRRIRKALSAVDCTIADATGVPPLLDFRSELDVSLAIRRGYARFRKDLRSNDPPTGETLYARLRGVGTQLAMLVGWDIYPELRVRDRLMLRDIQRRILHWLGAADRTTDDGARLWQDVAACAEILALVNSRAEVRAHDATAIDQVLSRLREGVDIADEEVQRLLHSLRGLDAGLDALAAAGSDGAARFVDELERVFLRFGTGTTQVEGVN